MIYMLIGLIGLTAIVVSWISIILILMEKL